jgi:hypothetical protein
MNWKVKAFIQNAVAYLPSKMSYEMYFQIQRNFGNLKKPHNPVGRFANAVNILKKIKQHGYETNGKIFFEVGSGHIPLFPIAFWLGGAKKTITVDLNPYLRNELIVDMLFFIHKEKNQIKNIFGDFLNEERFNALLDYSKSKNINKNDLLELCQIEYIAPCDAAKTNLPEKNINYHISNVVYEHIPLNIIHDILTEGNRIITEDGLFINNIDYSDHFAGMDKNISKINFLKYNDKKWDKYAGNRYMYMNRARHDDFIELFKSVGHDFVEIEPHKDEMVLELLENGKINLDTKFKEKGEEILSITGAKFITKISENKK